MGFSDVLWIFIILTSLQPVIKQRMLAAARTKAISKIGFRYWFFPALRPDWQPEQGRPYAGLQEPGQGLFKNGEDVGR